MTRLIAILATAFIGMLLTSCAGGPSGANDEFTPQTPQSSVDRATFLQEGFGQINRGSSTF